MPLAGLKTQRSCRIDLNRNVQMIVCSCNTITLEQIESAVRSIRSRDQNPTPSGIFRELNQSFDCAGCAALIAAICKPQQRGHRKTAL
jgi:bacterioferritin-associated ferredoxin